MSEHDEVKPIEHSEYKAHISHTAKKADDETFTIKKVTLWQGISSALFLLLLVSVFTGGFGYGSSGTAVAAAPNAAAPSAPSPTAPVNVELGNAPVKGDEDAPVTIIEFSDFQCPFCARFYSDTLGQIESQYVDTGKVKFAYKHFPLDSIHPQATPAALAAECAKEQGKFWEYHDALFASQAVLGDATYKKISSDLGLDTSRFNDCYDTQKYLTQVRNDLQEGSSAGIRGTPGFLVNGQIISGAQPFVAFQQAIEAALAG